MKTKLRGIYLEGFVSYEIVYIMLRYELVLNKTLLLVV